MIIPKTHILSIKSLFGALTLTLLLIAGCAQENPMLYDPSLRDSSVSMRFINMSPDIIPRTFTINGSSPFSNIAFGTSSDVRVNTIDSAHYVITKDGQEIFSTISLQRQKITIFRNTVQTFITAGIENSDSTYVMQLSTFRTDFARGKAKIRIVNTMPNNLPVNVHLGCEQGELLASFLKRGEISNETETLPGSNAITIVNAENNSFIGTFDKIGYSFSADSIYTVIIAKDPSTQAIRVFALNELSKDMQAFDEFPQAGMLSATIFMYNLISTDIDVEVKRGSLNLSLADDQSPFSSVSKTFGTCSSNAPDSVIVKDKTGRILAAESIVLSPYRTYSCVISRNILSPNGYELITSENLRTSPLNTMCDIRAINLRESNPIALNSAARTTGNQFEAGRILYSTLLNNDIATKISVQSGPLPLLLQTSSTPQIILSQCIGELFGGKNYLLIIGTDVICALDEASGRIVRFETGAILQLIHAASKQTTHAMTVGSIIQNANLQSDGVFTTVIPMNRTTMISSGANTASITAIDSNQRYNYAIDESKNILDYSYNRNLLDNRLTKLRVINLSPGTEVDLYLDYDVRLFNDTINRDRSRDFNSQIRGVLYKESSDYQIIDRERRLSFSLLQWQNPPLVYASLNNVLISLGKNYSIFLVPENDGSNRTIIRQEY